MNRHNEQIMFAFYTNVCIDGLLDVEKATRQTREEKAYDIHAAYKKMVRAIEGGNEADIYAASLSLSATAGAFGISYGDREDTQTPWDYTTRMRDKG